MPRYDQVKRVESANQLAMPVASDDEDDDLDHLLEHQHQRMMMRSSSAYSLASNPESNGQVRIRTPLLADGLVRKPRLNVLSVESRLLSLPCTAAPTLGDGDAQSSLAYLLAILTRVAVDRLRLFLFFATDLSPVYISQKNYSQH